MEQATQQKQYDSYVNRVTQIAKEEQIKKNFPITYTMRYYKIY
ncbi:hypothetical protein COLO4_15603 [Corchorus olitorius]|uniref:Uncharacterized protein n=1 Tax=Corchorus olitorius TaxID=93759 RepID=A0A1R3JM80_9ROSI|nr:hypothetical protein COLO4_15603 [Corchorus olitorius]